MLLPPFEAMALSLLGSLITTVATAALCGISCKMCSRFEPLTRLLLPTRKAFAAILGAGSVVTWGDADCGGDCSAVQDLLI